MKAEHKVTAQHLSRKAFLYVRQSTMRQVLENTESTARQYALRQRAVALGWPIEQVVVIDSDLGQSGASSTDREGFKTLVSEVGMGHAGIVMGLEVSRLARNSSDWHRLLASVPRHYRNLRAPALEASQREVERNMGRPFPRGFRYFLPAVDGGVLVACQILGTAELTRP